MYNEPEDYIGSDKIYADIIGKLFGPILKQSLNFRRTNDMRLKKDELTRQLGLKVSSFKFRFASLQLDEETVQICLKTHFNSNELLFLLLDRTDS